MAKDAHTPYIDVYAHQNSCLTTVWVLTTANLQEPLMGAPWSGVCKVANHVPTGKLSSLDMQPLGEDIMGGRHYFSRLSMKEMVSI